MPKFRLKPPRVSVCVLAVVWYALCSPYLWVCSRECAPNIMPPEARRYCNGNFIR
jgi:hypothetical protein